MEPIMREARFRPRKRMDGVYRRYGRSRIEAPDVRMLLRARLSRVVRNYFVLTLAILRAHFKLRIA